MADFVLFEVHILHAFYSTLGEPMDMVEIPHTDCLPKDLFVYEHHY